MTEQELIEKIAKIIIGGETDMTIEEIADAEKRLSLIQFELD